MSLQARVELVNSIRERYLQADKKTKGKILDEFAQATGYGRKHAIAVLRREPQRTESQRPQARKRKYGEDVKETLVHVWRIANEICSKRLVPFLPDLLDALERSNQLRVSTDIRNKLVSMCPDTVDRLLADVRKNDNRGRSTTRPGALLKRQIPVRTFADWNDVVPGFFEADLVAHCGSDASGSFLNSLVMTDIATGWTECFALLRKSEFEVVEALKVAQRLLPTPIIGFDSDNGSEFINNGLIDFCKEHEITFTRARAYKKNDQAHVEEKNGSIVRRTVGYDRYEGVEAQRRLERLYQVLRLYVNFFQPSMKLLSKTREGAKLSRRYDKAQTPFRRMLNSPDVSEEAKIRLRSVYATLNPVDLWNSLEELQDSFWQRAWKRDDGELIIPKKQPHSAVSAAQSVLESSKQEPVVEIGKKAASTRQYRKSGKPKKTRKPRTHRTRKDPFESVKTIIEDVFRTNQTITAKEMLSILQEKHPGQFSTAQQRTLMRRLNMLRNATDGPKIPSPGRKSYPKHIVRGPAKKS